MWFRLGQTKNKLSPTWIQEDKESNPEWRQKETGQDTAWRQREKGEISPPLVEKRKHKCTSCTMK